jgi:hypothetical protein
LIPLSIPAAHAAARANLLTPTGQINNILHLTVLQGVGRSFALGYDEVDEDARCLTLNLSAENLEVVAWLDDSHQLTLWQFAQARERMSLQTEVVAFDTLDEYGFYRAHGCSYYASDEPRPNLISILPDFSEALRYEAHERRDRIAAYHPDLRSVLDLANWHSDPSIPIYGPLPNTPVPFCLFVAHLPLPIWVVTPSLHPDARYRPIYLQIADLVAYWVWQVAPGIEQSLAVMAETIDCLMIDIELVPGENWFTRGHSTGGSGSVHCHSTGSSDSVHCQARDIDRMNLVFEPSITNAFASADNAGERDVVRALLRGLQDWCQRSDVQVTISDADIEDMLVRFAPLGLKKKLLLFDADSNPQLNDSGLPRYRRVQEFNRQEVIDEIGDFARGVLGHAAGTVAVDQRVTLLNRLVTNLYTELQRLVATLSSVGLLESLVARNERIIYTQEFREFATPTGIACFGSESEFVERLRKGVLESGAAALASRFLIEYVTARPPFGDRRLSTSMYDRLLALGSEIINLGLSSDAIYYGLSEHTLTVLASGRLAVDAGRFGAAIDDFRDVHTLGVIDRSHRNFGRHWDSTSGSLDRDELDPIFRIDDACVEEFGFSLEELNHFLGEVGAIGLETPGEPKVLPESLLRQQIMDRLHWTNERVSQAFELFALRSRPDFLQPSAGSRQADVLPWRFNRALSYIRRPLLVRGTDQGDEVVWGVRMVRMAAGYLTSLCLGGRLIARTRAMQQVMGALHKKDGREFNDRVANMFREVQRLRVRERVKRVGEQRIARANGEDLGDVDVLVADVSTRELIPVETKDLAVALTPPEIRNEIDELFGSREGHPGAIDRFMERVTWIRQYLSTVLGFLGLSGEDPAQWRVRPMLILDRELISPFLARRTDLEILSIRALRVRLAQSVSSSGVRMESDRSEQQPR